MRTSVACLDELPGYRDSMGKARDCPVTVGLLNHNQAVLPYEHQLPERSTNQNNSTADTQPKRNGVAEHYAVYTQ